MNINKVINSKVEFSNKGLNFYKWLNKNSLSGNENLVYSEKRLFA
jgi:hypothetical protein